MHLKITENVYGNFSVYVDGIYEAHFKSLSEAEQYINRLKKFDGNTEITRYEEF